MGFNQRRFIFLFLGLLALGILLFSKSNPFMLQVEENRTAVKFKKNPRFLKKRKTHLIKKNKKTVARENFLVTRFKKFLSTTLLNIPSIREVHRLSQSETHFIPLILLKAGENLGKVAEQLETYPELRNEGIAFYSLCSQNANFHLAIRALCLSNLIFYKRLKGLKTDLSIFPESLKKLVLRGGV
jgi:hypothetical protein